MKPPTLEPKPRYELSVPHYGGRVEVFVCIAEANGSARRLFMEDFASIEDALDAFPTAKTKP